MEMLSVIMILIVYLLPGILGADKRDAGGILMLNFFLGWTIVGYIIALTKALASDTEVDS